MTRSVQSVVPGVTATDELSGVKNYITSDDCITQLIAEVGLEKKSTLSEKALALKDELPQMSVEEIEQILFIEQVRTIIKVETERRDIIRLSAYHRNPNKAYLLAQSLAKFFIDEFQKRQIGGIQGIREFSEVQLAIYKEKLRESEQRLKQFKEGVLKSQMKDLDMSEETLERLTADIATLDVSISDKEARLQLLGKKLSSSTSNIQRSSAFVSESEKNLYATINELVAILSKFTWTDPQIIELNDKRNALRNQIREEIMKMVESKFKGKDIAEQNLIVAWNMTHLDIDLLNYERNAMTDMLRKLEKSMTKAPTNEMLLTNLEQQVEQNRNLYLKFEQQTQGSYIEEQIQRIDSQFQLQIIEMAKKPLYPINKGAKHAFMLAILPIFGLVLGGGIIYLLDFMDDSITDVDDFESKFNLPVWGVIPEIENLNNRLWRKEFWKYVVVAVGTTIAAAIIFIVTRTDLLKRTDIF